MVVDWIGQSTAAPGSLLDDLAASACDGTGGSLQRTLDLVFRQIGTQHEHQFVSAHAPRTPSHGNAPMRERQRRSVGAERTCEVYQGPAFERDWRSPAAPSRQFRAGHACRSRGRRKHGHAGRNSRRSGQHGCSVSYGTAFGH